MYQECHKPISKGDKVNCGTCKRWDLDKGKCSIKDAEDMAAWEQEHGWSERMMQQNRGVRIE